MPDTEYPRTHSFEKNSLERRLPYNESPNTTAPKHGSLNETVTTLPIQGDPFTLALKELGFVTKKRRADARQARRLTREYANGEHAMSQTPAKRLHPIDTKQRQNGHESPETIRTVTQDNNASDSDGHAPHAA